MPYERTEVEPEIFLQHGNFVVFYIYRNDRVDDGPRNGWYSLTTDGNDNDDHGQNGTFEVAQLPDSPHSKASLESDEGEKAHIIAAIDAGYFADWDHDEPEPAPPPLAPGELPDEIDLSGLRVYSLNRDPAEEATIFGTAEIMGRMHHVQLTEVDDMGQPIHDPHKRLEDLEAMQPSPCEHIDLAPLGIPGYYVLCVYPFGD